MRRFYVIVLNILFTALLLIVSSQSVLAQLPEDCPEDYPSIGYEESNGSVCNIPGEVTFTISENTYNNPNNKYCTYYIQFDDETDIYQVKYGLNTVQYAESIRWDKLIEKKGIITHKYSQAYCSIPGKSQWTIHIYVISDCGPDLKKDGTFSVFLQQKGDVSFTANDVCEGETAIFNNYSKSFINQDCQPATYYSWYFGDNSKVLKVNSNESVSHVYECSGIYDVQLNAYTNSLRKPCGSDSMKKTITVIPLPKIIRQNSKNVCKGEKINNLTTTALDYGKYDFYNHDTKKCEEIVWKTKFPNDPVVNHITYIVSGDYIGLDRGSYYNKKEVPAFTTVNETDGPLTANICIIPYNKLNCPGDSICYSITVQPGAKLNPINNQSVCDGSASNVIKFSSTVSGTTFSWKVDEADKAKATQIGMPKTEGQESQIASFNATNSTDAPISVKITVKADVTCGSVEKQFTITAYPKSMITPMDTTFCNNTSFSIVPKNGRNGKVLTGTKYKWTVKEDPSGMGAKGSVSYQNSISDKLGNTTGSEQYVIYTVTPNVNNCDGAEFEIKVKVKPGVLIQDQFKSICSGDNIPPMEWAGDNIIPEGMLYKWDAPASSSVTGITSGNNQEKFSQGNLVNKTNQSVTLKYMVTPVKEGMECPAPAFPVNVTIKPRPSISTINATTCSDYQISVTPVNDTDGIVPVNTNYSWAVPAVAEDSISGGVSGSGTTTINATLHNKTDKFAIATYSVTPTKDGCVGDNFDVRIKVNPVVQINSTIETTVCNDGTYNIPIKNGEHGVVPAGTTYTWIVYDAESGVTGGTSGQGGELVTGHLINSTNSVKKVTYKLSPVSENCNGKDFNVVVSVLPSVVGQISGGATVCVGAESPKIVFSANYGTPPYEFTYSINGGQDKTVLTEAGQSSVSIDADVSSKKIDTYHLKNVKDSREGEGCASSASGDAVIKVIDNPTVSIIYNGKQTICAGGVPDSLTAIVNGEAVAKAYQWYFDDTVIAGATDSVYKPVAISSVGDHTYKVMVQFETSGCVQAEGSKTMTAVEGPQVDEAQLAEQTLCVGNAATAWSVKGKGGTNIFAYQWFKDGEKIENATNTSYTPSTNEVGTFVYFCKIYTLDTEGDTLDCSVNSDNATLIVRKSPEVSLAQLSIGCTETNITIGDTIVTYTWYDVVEKKPTWSVYDKDGNELTSGYTVDDKNAQYPTFSFEDAGQYKIRVTMPDIGCGSALFAEQAIEILNAKFDLKLEMTQDRECVPIKVEFDNQTATDQQISYKWTVAPPDGVTPSESTDAKPTIQFSQEGQYNIKVTASNFCYSKDAEFVVASKDNVTFSIDDIDGVCGEYMFDAAQLLQIVGEEANIKSVEWSVTPEDNVEYIEGTKTSLKPKIKFGKWGEYTIQISAETVCNTETASAKIVIDEPVEITLTKPDYVCANIAEEFDMNPYTLVAIPADGTWSLETQPEWLRDGKFYPNAPGTYKIDYFVQHKSCTAVSSMDILVPEYPSMSIGDNIVVCSKDIEPRLLTATPDDGIWAGNEVSKGSDGKYYFNPPIEEGEYSISYTITSSDGCKNKDYKRGIVMPLPKTGFSNDDFCLHNNPMVFNTEADPSVSTFLFDYGDGTTGSETNHIYESIGVYDVKLIITAGNGCVDSLSQKLMVEKIPDQKIKLSKDADCSVFTPEITPEFDYIDSLRTTFKWDFGVYGTDEKFVPSPVGFQAIGYDKTYDISFTVDNYCGSTTETETINVYAMAQAVFSLGLSEGCSPVPTTFKNESLGNSDGMHFIWDFGDGSLRSDERFPNPHVFTTRFDKDTVYNIMLIAENRCGADTTYREMYVVPPIIKPQLLTLTQNACIGDEVCFVDKTIKVRDHSEILSYAWDFGNGHKSYAPNENCTRYNDVGPYKVKLTVSTSCGSVESDSVDITLFAGPEYELNVDRFKCLKDTLVPRLNVMTDYKGVEWDFGDGTHSTSSAPKHTYTEEGQYKVKVTVIANNFGSCPASDSVMVDVKPVPEPVILNLERDSCGPFVYTPEYSIQYYTTVDYEGTGYPESSDSHTYTNHTLEPVIYYPKFYFEDLYGCKSSQTGMIKIYPQPEAKFTIDKVVKERPEVVYLHNESYGADECRWILPYKTEIATCSDTTEEFYNNDVKDLILTVANLYGCTDTYSVEYHPLMKGLFFPNTFSPNGVIPEVRTFNGVGIGLKEYELEVFDMYGNRIFHTTSLDAEGKPNEGWNGCDSKGKQMPQDVYTWKAKATFIDSSDYPYGNSKKTGGETLQRGSVLLLQK